jgi:hypothetical protein
VLSKFGSADSDDGWAILHCSPSLFDSKYPFLKSLLSVCHIHHVALHVFREKPAKLGAGKNAPLSSSSQNFYGVAAEYMG